MSKLVEFRSPNGTPLWINPDRVEAIVEDNIKDCTSIHLAGQGRHLIKVSGTARAVAEALNAGETSC